jgi:acetylglutamate kinase
VRDVSLLKEALPYLRLHRRQVMVLKLGGEIAADAQALRSLAQEISLLVHVNLRLVVVHG